MLQTGANDWIMRYGTVRYVLGRYICIVRVLQRSSINVELSGKTNRKPLHTTHNTNQVLRTMEMSVSSIYRTTMRCDHTLRYHHI